MKRNTYLNVVDIEEARTIIEKEFIGNYSYKTEVISVYDSLNRITAQPIIAKISNPHYNASAMDGISLNAKVTFGAHEKSPIVLREGQDFKYVDTGDPIIEGHNAVVMIEDVYEVEKGKVEILKASFPWEHVRVVGEDIGIGDMIVPSMHRIKPVDIGAIISGGVEKVEVIKKVSVGIIPTGTEIVNLGQPLDVGNILDSNSRVFETMTLEAGGIPNRIDPVIDDYNLLKEAILKSVDENDMVVINAGSSAGTEDYTVGIIRELGEVYVHGISIKPGKPTIIGRIKGKAVIGIPGYPVSAFISFREFVLPMVSILSEKKDKDISVKLSKRIVSALKHREYVRMKIGKVGNTLIGTPLSRGAGVTMSLVKADGILTIPKNVEGLEAGQMVDITLLRPESRIEQSLVSIGSHDIIMDYINDLMAKDFKGFSLSSAHVGSLGGIMAVKKGETHIAPIHLLDEKSGDYNVSFVKKYLKGEKVSLLKGIKRWQGLYVKKGNPLNIKTIEDLVVKDLIFANRQKGSGTRVLLDYLLKKEDLNKESIAGYMKEYTTHTNVALAVQSGNAHVGLGIQSVANMMDLDFIPIALEEYDFLIPDKYREDEKVLMFEELIKSNDFINTLNDLGGYQVEDFTWQVIE